MYKKSKNKGKVGLTIERNQFGERRRKEKDEKARGKESGTTGKVHIYCELRLTKTPESRLPAVLQTQPPVSPITPHGYISLIGPAPAGVRTSLSRSESAYLASPSGLVRFCHPTPLASTGWPYSFPSLASPLCS